MALTVPSGCCSGPGKIQKPEKVQDPQPGADHPEGVCALNRAGAEGLIVLYDTKSYKRISETLARGLAQIACLSCWLEGDALGADTVAGTAVRLTNCHNFHDFRELARRRLPGPIFNYIDAAADDEITHRQNTASFDRWDLVPNVLRGVETVDMSVTIILHHDIDAIADAVDDLPQLIESCARSIQLPAAMVRQHDAATASKFGTMFGVSSLGTVSGDSPLSVMLKQPLQGSR